jgi:hypothetical protein
MLVTRFALFFQLFHISHAAPHVSVLAGMGRDRYFNPSEQDVESSVAAIMHNMTMQSALSMLSKSNQAPSSLLASVQIALRSKGDFDSDGTSSTIPTESASASASIESLNQHVHFLASHSQSQQRSQKRQKGSIFETMEMLNEMIYESTKKYDLEQATCSNFYTKQSAEMETCRAEMSAASAAAAACKAKTLSAQGQVAIAAKSLPKLRLTLSDTSKSCKKQVSATKKHLDKVMGDIAVMTQILKMTDCKAFVQTKGLGLLHCQTACVAKTYVEFEDGELRQKVGELQSAVAHEALQDTLAQLFGNVTQAAGVQLLQEHQPVKSPKVKKAKMLNKPKPRVLAPSDPCKDANGGVPSAANKRAAKCTIKGTPNCPKMQNRFLFIQAGMLDERDGLKEQLSEMDIQCDKRLSTLQTQVDQHETMLKDEQTKLADASSCETTASEKGRLVAEQHEELEKDMSKMQASCQSNFHSLLFERCGLRKIRAQVLKMSDLGLHIQDCKLGKWEPGQCSKKCGGGVQVMSRKVMMPPEGGTQCLPLEQNRTCNDSPCPVDCKVAEWTTWSRCSAQCGGGVTQRARDIITHMMHNGKPCGATSEAKSCNVQACDKACKLNKWTKWSKCSKQCDGGTQKRTKFVAEEATGEGKCPDESAPERLQYKKCNYKRCRKAVRSGKPTLQCMSKLDVILVLDGGTALGAAGWSKTVEAAKLFLSSFQDNKDARVAVLSFSGPTTWFGVSKCMGEVPGQIDLEKDCRISWAQRFSSDFEDTSKSLSGLAWPKGGSLTSLALTAAENELQLARKDAEAVVVVLTDGRPFSIRRTSLAAERIKKKARLMWVPVTKFQSLKNFKSWASKRWQENVLQVSSYASLAKPQTVDHLIASMCGKVDGGVPTAKEQKSQLKKLMKKMSR